MGAAALNISEKVVVNPQSPPKPVLRLEDYPYRLTDNVRYGDLDPNHHVNNATYSTYFETGRDYRIALGKDLPTPYYDIGFFKDSIPMNPGELEIGNLKESAVLRTPESPTFFTDRRYIWAAIILVGIVLAAMTVRMMRDKDFRNRQ